ncbi:non-hemolytic phospholipase C [Actinoplanes philippinensis]|uniref:phospholipase C n=1 Tax=Actinoplanes philippinensis TaxID=35752 RepID=A0A1I2B4Z3_9ACTN|nr:phospholipase C, phosphocholine-specific [Actinoplanes philippinensis]GIE75655.1 non-hemolytic phospholipase C [Actinoplanes philippinensis]SFE50230.1 phospholipase C [Actinoplanes philippinensis]
MAEFDRRSFLQMLGMPAVAAAVPAGLERALSIPADVRTGTIRDIDHVVILMQENRSFDHYFGTLRGVRGFADPHPVTLPSGRSVWHQPHGAGELLPFRPDVPDVGGMFLPDPPHGWRDTHDAVNDGRYDRWVPNKGVQTMTHHVRADLPYHFALADAFTICDNYFCSLMGSTDPNRYHLWTGWVGNDGSGGGPVVDNAELGYDWTTYPERLERNGVPWRIYQDTGTGLTAAGGWGWTRDPFIGNYGDNSLLYFHQYQNAAPGTPLADRARTGTEVNRLGRLPDALLSDFREDVRNDRLPAVSWVVAPEAYTEHPNWGPHYGEWYVSQVVDILASNPKVWGRMALFITYDEEGGFFDHLVPPVPEPGRSTVDTVHEIFPGSAKYPAGPYGLGIRVPTIVVSPWTRGGWVNSQLFDHTSLIRFLEARFARGNPDLIESNITPWRRAVSGDLTSAFDFRNPNRRTVRLPGTDGFKPADLTRRPDEQPVPPADPELPAQERGVRPARPLPYTLHADGRAVPDGFEITFRNTGRATAVFQAHSGDPAHAPRTFTVEPGRQLTDHWAAAAGADLQVRGPNGFFRHFRGAPPITVRARYDERRHTLLLEIRNTGPKRADVTVTDRYTGHAATLGLRAGTARTSQHAAGRTGGWYDVSVTAGDGPLVRYAGHIEDGEESISDPRMGGLV